MGLVERPGYPALQLGRCAVRLDVDPLDVSSTQVRQRLTLGESIDELVPLSVGQLLRAEQ